MKDMLYTAGVIAIKECALLGDKLNKMCELSPDEAFRMLLESGYGAGAEVESAFDYEKLITVSERSADAFIREYAPSEAEKAYLLLERDFHNAKAIVKANFKHLPYDGLLSPDGTVSADFIAECISGERLDLLPARLASAIERASVLLEDGGDPADVSPIFDKAYYESLASACKKNRTLSALVKTKADMQNVLLAFRSKDKEEFEKLFLPSGKLPVSAFEDIFADRDKAEHALDGTPYEKLCRSAADSKFTGKPLTEGERAFSSFEATIFHANAYELTGSAKFLYYVMRLRRENTNVRIVMACLLAGMDPVAIRARLRG